MERELRIAPVMTGGTSLAVWMGGVTAELYRLSRSQLKGSESPYTRLLTLTDTVPVIDVVTGTSAGGLNGTLLAAATAWDLPTTEFLTLRDTWMNVADIERLMRKPTEVDPPSLLQGDAVFAAELEKVLQRWRTVTAKKPAEPTKPTKPAADVDLVTTYTAIHPNPRHRSDDFGEGMNEVTYAGTLHFGSRHFRDDDIAAKLAIASRTSACIPGVFETSFLPCGEADAGASGRPDFDKHVPVEQRGISRWAVDGGVVVNLPLTEALDRVFSKKASGLVRRVALYVCPTPAEQRKSRSDQWTDVPQVRASLGTIIAAPRAEGIASDIDEIRANNSQVERQRDSRYRLALLPNSLDAATGGPSAPGRPTLFETFRQARARESITAMLDRLRQEYDGQLPVDEDQLAANLLQPRIELLPTRLDVLPPVPGPPYWMWGIAPVEHAVSVGLDLVNRALQLCGPGSPPEVVRELRRAKKRLHRHRETSDEIRQLDATFWTDRIRELPASDGSIDPYVKFAAESYVRWPYVSGSDDRRHNELNRLGAAHLKIAESLKDIGAALRRTAQATDVAWRDAAENRGPETSSPTYSWLREQAERGRTLRTEVEMLLPAGSTTAGVQLRLLKLHVVQTVLLGGLDQREQRVELMQVSWNAPDYLTGRPAVDKLTGPELARLGAFLKPSWRANDWLWGRLDGAARLTQMLLDPQRLRALGRSADEVLHELGVTESMDEEDERREAICAELAFLDHDQTPTPRGLPRTVAYVARDLQARIAAEELPKVAAAIHQSTDAGANDPSHGVFANAVDNVRAAHGDDVPPAKAPELLTQLTVGTETLESEFGSDLTARVLTRGSGVLVNVVTSPKAGLSVVGRALRVLRGPLHTLNAVIGVLTNRSRLARGLTAFLLAVAGAVVAVKLSGVPVWTPVWVFSIVLVVAILGWSLARTRHWLVLLGVVSLGLIAMTVALGPDLDTVLYSETRPEDIATVRVDDSVVLDGGGRVRITDGGSGKVNDYDLGSDSTITLRSSSGDTELRTPPGAGVSRWKDVWFLRHYSLVPLLCFAGAAALLLALAFRPQKWRRAGVAIAGAVLIVLGMVTPWLTGYVLTGGRPGPAWKNWLATTDLSLPVLLIGFVLASVLIGAGVDLWVTKVVPGLRRRRTS